ncbi:hypothetical protein ABIF64_003122 [Bradyrhizobium japonicum]|uniref:Uncharacterized protein n=1 Tax=Bradyrhizobium japonicum TaxID=375 RepID=A0ABV2S8K2_BRAJP
MTLREIDVPPPFTSRALNFRDNPNKTAGVFVRRRLRFFCSSPENKGRRERSERKDLILSPIERREQMNWLHGIEAMPFNARELMNCHPCLCGAMRGSEGA